MLDVLGALGSIKAPTGTLEYGNVGQTDCVFLRLVGGPGNVPYLIYTAEELVDLISILRFAERLGQGTQPGTILRLGALRPKPLVLRLALVHPNSGPPFVLLRICHGRNKIDIPVQISSALELLRQGQPAHPAAPVCGMLRRDASGVWLVGGQELHVVNGHSPGTGVYGEYLHPDEVRDGEDLVIWSYASQGKQWVGAFRTLQQWQAPATVTHAMAQEGDVALFHGETYRCRQILKTFARQQSAHGDIEPVWAAKIALSSLLCDIANGEDEAGHRTWLGQSDDPILQQGIEAIEAGYASGHDLAIYEQVCCYFHSLGADRQAAVDAVNQIMERLFAEVSDTEPQLRRLILHNWAYLLKEIFDGKPSASVAGAWKTCKDRYPGRIVPKVLSFPPPYPWVLDWLPPETELEEEQEDHSALFPDEQSDSSLFPDDEEYAPPEEDFPPAPLAATLPPLPDAAAEYDAISQDDGPSSDRYEDEPPPQVSHVVEEDDAPQEADSEDQGLEFDAEPDSDAAFSEPIFDAGEPAEEPKPARQPAKGGSKAPLLIGLVVLLAVGAAGAHFLSGQDDPKPGPTPLASGSPPPLATTSPPALATPAPTAVAVASATGAATPTVSGSPAPAVPTPAATVAPPPATLGALGKPNVGGLDPEGRYYVDRGIAGLKMLEQGPGWGSYDKGGSQIILGAKQTGTIKSTKAKSFASTDLFVGGKKVLGGGIKLEEIPPATRESLASWEVRVLLDESGQNVLGYATGEEFPEGTVALSQPLGGGLLLKAYESRDLAGFKATLNKENANLLFMDGGTLLSKVVKQTSSADFVKAVLEAGGNVHGSGGLQAFWSSIDPAVVSLILKAGHPPDATDPDGKTKLFGAAPDMIKLLLDSKANPNAADNEGKTALMGADAEKTRALLLGGADVKLKDKAGKTALDYADGDAAVLALLKKPPKPAKPASKPAKPAKAK